MTRRRVHALAHAVRAVALLARDDRVPRPLRVGAAFGLAPLPGPLDELVLLAVAAALWLFYRERLRAAWAAARDPADGNAT